ncbi:MAG: chromate transporter [Bacilli bacterium]|nr:chromate transporter [Bacilli bacterium]
MKTLLVLFLAFLKLGAFTFGGGYAMIPEIKATVVEKYHWLTDDEILEVIAIAESTPGPMAINMATFVGYKIKGFFGSLVATLSVSLPSFIIIFVISLFLQQFLALEYVTYAFVGINAAVAILIIFAGLDMIKKMKKTLLPVTLMILTLGLSILFDVLDIPFSAIYYILIGGFIGILLSLYRYHVTKKNKAILLEGLLEEEN